MHDFFKKVSLFGEELDPYPNDFKTFFFSMNMKMNKHKNTQILDDNLNLNKGSQVSYYSFMNQNHILNSIFLFYYKRHANLNDTQINPKCQTLNFYSRIFSHIYIEWFQ